MLICKNQYIEVYSLKFISFMFECKDIILVVVRFRKKRIINNFTNKFKSIKIQARSSL
ncbi:hypothetical protein [Cetobacterium sp.]|uniref:hypothetical protein n=1 Tax=Cetobacterium sp. TaxID=2071632 RepID=UPI003F36D8F6